MKTFLLITLFLSSLIFTTQNQLDYEQIKEFILDADKKNKEFILVLKSGEKYRVSEVVSVGDDAYEFNILQDRLSGSVFYKNNISKRSNYNYGNTSKFVINIESNQILMVENITYTKQIKEIRNYTFIVLGMYLIFSVFSS
tara:strand:- start:1387 stop:1809 length:423 start_codon:yes stop_codon:yes gene_type:complete